MSRTIKRSGNNGPLTSADHDFNMGLVDQALESIENINFDGVKVYETLADAIAVTPTPADYTGFSVDPTTDPDNAGQYYYLASEQDGVKKYREFIDNKFIIDYFYDGILEFGGITTSGAEVFNDVRARSLLFKVPVGTYKIVLPSTVLIGFVVAYEGNTPSQYISNNTSFTTTGNQDGIRFSLKKVDGSSFTSTEIQALDISIISSNEVDLQQLPKLVEFMGKVDINYENQGFEFGGIDASGGEVSNFVRVRSVDVVSLLQGDYTLINRSDILDVNKCYGYLDGSFIGEIPFANSKITIGSNINGIRLSLAKPDGSTITQQQLDDLVFEIKKDDLSPQTNAESTVSGFYAGKKLAVLGDSISYGFIPRNDPDYPGQLDSYAKLLAQELGMSFQNNGINGSTLGALSIGTSSNSPFVYRYNDLDDDAKLIIVKGGTNDLNKGIPLGTFTDTDETTYYGALHILAKGLIEKYYINQGLTIGQGVDILFIASIKQGIDLEATTNAQGKTIRDYGLAVKEVAEYYSLQFWDGWSLSGLNPHIFRTVTGVDAPSLDDYNPYMPDAVHPNQEGHAIMARNLKRFIDIKN
ncbi:SGNH/GDSL hydrolase family protein [Nonlabens sp. SCSIO 43208]|uniref:SGNH/GDSL hydrolase family protein n=1 Tax=Nonlabens sp. SCSIO 43208 TaxID=2793009 RepID=UPI003D6BE393